MSQLYLFCPACQSHLPVRYVPAPGTPVRCPKCSHIFGAQQVAAPGGSQPAPLAPLQPLPQPQHQAPQPQYQAKPPQPQRGLPRAQPLPQPTAPARPQGYPQQQQPHQHPIQPLAPLGGTTTFGAVAASPLPASPTAPAEAKMNGLVFGIVAVAGGAVVLVLLLIVTMSMGKNEPKPVAQAPADATAPQTGQPTSTPKSTSILPVFKNPFSSSPTGGTTVASLPPVSSQSQLSYGWLEGKSYQYQFTARRDNGSSVTTGAVTYSVNSALTAKAARTDAAVGSREGSGTGFVVHSDGLLATCAHCVEGVSKIEVNLGGRSYPGTVVGLDQKHDLALVRIPATGLPALHLANSDAVQLAEEVRAVGYPLSDFLGTSVKITRGSIAGVMEKNGDKLLQVDATINPGNSGGPLVNSRGEVVGVVSSGLFGESISEVGFSVPSNDARRLMDSKGVVNSAAGSTTELSGPDLARKVTPSVAFLKLSMEGPEDGSKQVLAFSGNWTTTGRSPGTARGQVLATSAGQVVSEEGDDDAKLPTTSLAALVFEPLPMENKDTWEVRRVASISVPIGGGPAAGMPGLRRPGFSRMTPIQPQQVVTIPIVETAEYRIVRKDSSTIEVTKRYELTAATRAGEPALFTITGNGTWMFDATQRIPKSLKFKLTLSSSIGDTPETGESNLEYNLLNVTDGALAINTAPPTRPSTPLTPPRPTTPSAPPSGSSPNPFLPGNFGDPPPGSVASPSPRTPANLDRLGQIITVLKTGDTSFGTLFSPLHELARIEPVADKREEVAALLDPLLANKNSSIRSAAMRAVEKWGTERNVGTLLSILDSTDSSARRDAMNALGGVGGKEAGQKLASLMTSDDDRLWASRGLKRMGLGAEDVVIPLLKHSNDQTRWEATRILADVGAQKSIAALQQMVRTEKSAFNKAGAEMALRQIQGRLGAK